MRRDLDKYMLEIANVVGSRGTCNRGRCGCVIEQDKHIISMGYVGAPSGMPHCDDEGHLIEEGSCIRSCHAEQNAICQAARYGISIKGSTLYTTMFPCYACAKMIVNVGIICVIAEYDYHKSARSKEMFDQLGIAYKLINNKVKEYDSTNNQ